MLVSNATTPDISNTVSEVARHAYDPSMQKRRATLKIAQYLKGTREKRYPTRSDHQVGQLLLRMPLLRRTNKIGVVVQGPVLFADGVVSLWIHCSCAVYQESALVAMDSWFRSV